MPMHTFTATFENGETATRVYAKPLTHAYRIASRPAGSTVTPAVKIAFAGSEALAKKAVKKGKKWEIVSCEIVEAKDQGLVESKAKAPKKAKKAKPFEIGETVEIKAGNATARGTVEKIGTKYVYVRLPSFKAPRKYAFADVAKLTPPEQPAPAMAA